MKDEYIKGSSAPANAEKNIIVIEAAEQPEQVKVRVAAYCRVSTDSDDQENSFAAQTRYFTTKISANENWSLVDIYADEGTADGVRKTT